MNQEADIAPPIELSSIPKRWIMRVGYEPSARASHSVHPSGHQTMAHGMNDTASAARLPHHGRGDCDDPLLVGCAHGSRSRPRRAAGITSNPSPRAPRLP